VVAERGGRELVAAAETILSSVDRDDAFDAVGTLTRALEARMTACGADWDELGDWWRRL
jgi:hypothetical protein